MPSDFETEYPDDFVSQTVSDIGESLFPKSNSGGEDSIIDKPGENASVKVEGEGEVKEPVVAPVTGQEGITPGQNSVGKPLPRSWKKDMAPHWEKLDPAVHEYVYAREADVMRGFQQYQAGYQQWDALVKPYAPIFEQHPDVKPVELMHGLMNTHLQLLNPQIPAEKKAQMAKAIMADYGITFDATPAGEVDPRVAHLEARLAQSENVIRQWMAQQQQAQQQTFQRGIEEQSAIIDAFASDPKNEFFNEVGHDILRFIEAGAAKDLASAYELACLANPAVRVKYLAKQQAVNTPAPAPQRNGRGQFINVEGTEQAKIRTRKGSIDDTIDAVVKAAYSSH